MIGPAFGLLLLVATTAGPNEDLVLETARGDIGIVLDPASRSPLREVFRGWSAADPKSVPALRHFDDVLAHVEIRTEPLAEVPELTLAVVLDAVALGLEDRRVGGLAEATDLVQRQLLPAWPGQARRGTATPRLREWIERWYAEFDPSFLLGVSHRDVLEALGLHFEAGGAARRPERGTVMFVPGEPGRASSRLAILLADQPALTGRAWVIGRVVRGLEVAESISLGSLAQRGPHARRLSTPEPFRLRVAHPVPLP